MADQGTVNPSTGDQGTGSGRQVFRTPGSVVLCWAWLVVAVLILGSVALRGHNHAGAVAALVVIAITGCMYACAWQPRIVADADGITVQNPLRWHILPWAVVTQVDLVQTVQVHHTGSPGESRDRIVHSWAVQSSAASRTRAELRAKRNARLADRTAPRAAPRASPGTGSHPTRRRGPAGIGRGVRHQAAQRAARGGAAAGGGRRSRAAGRPGSGGPSALGLVADRRHRLPAAALARGRPCAVVAAA